MITCSILFDEGEALTLNEDLIIYHQMHDKSVFLHEFEPLFLWEVKLILNSC